jgi:hypothetical protein
MQDCFTTLQTAEQVNLMTQTHEYDAAVFIVIYAAELRPPSVTAAALHLAATAAAHAAATTAACALTCEDTCSRQTAPPSKGNKGSMQADVQAGMHASRHTRWHASKLPQCAYIHLQNNPSLHPHPAEAPNSPHRRRLALPSALQHQNNPERSQQHSPLPAYRSSNEPACAYAQTCCTTRDWQRPAAAILSTPTLLLTVLVTDAGC